MRADEIDFERLSTYLKALAHPARLEILWRLRIPAAPSDIVVKPRRRDEGLSPERPMSRQSIMEHIEQLDAVGVVDRVPAEDGKWVTSTQHLFAIVEDLRKLSAIEPAMRVDVDSTFVGSGDAVAPAAPGPKLVAVGGPWEGRVFPLSGAGPWSIGRTDDQTVALSYDPFASHESARVTKNGGGFTVETAAGARNPARVNFAPLDAGKARPLAAGDILGIGRSLLVFQDR